MQETPEQTTPMQDKIEKLKSLITEGDKSGHNTSDNQYNRDEKLQQKLRYLQFFDTLEKVQNLGDAQAAKNFK